MRSELCIVVLHSAECAVHSTKGPWLHHASYTDEDHEMSSKKVGHFCSQLQEFWEHPLKSFFFLTHSAAHSGFASTSFYRLMSDLELVTGGPCLLLTVLLQQETTRHVYGPGDIISAENGFKLTSPFKKKQTKKPPKKQTRYIRINS